MQAAREVEKFTLRLEAKWRRICREPKECEHNIDGWLLVRLRRSNGVDFDNYLYPPGAHAPGFRLKAARVRSLRAIGAAVVSAADAPPPKRRLATQRRRGRRPRQLSVQGKADVAEWRQELLDLLLANINLFSEQRRGMKVRAKGICLARTSVSSAGNGFTMTRNILSQAKARSP